MQKPSDEVLIAYLDGELDAGARAEVEAWLEQDAAMRERAAGLVESAQLLRAAFDPVLHEPVPERLLAAARGETMAPASEPVAPGDEPTAIRQEPAGSPEDTTATPSSVTYRRRPGLSRFRSR